MSSRSLVLGFLSRFSAQHKASPNSKSLKLFFRTVSDPTVHSVPSVNLICKRCKSTRDDFSDEWKDDFSSRANSVKQAKWKDFDDFDFKQPKQRSHREHTFFDDLPPPGDQEDISDFASTRHFRSNRSKYSDDRDRFFNRSDSRIHRPRRSFRNFDSEERDMSFPERDFGFGRTEGFSDFSGDRSFDDIFDNLRTKTKDFTKQPPIKKDLYTEHENVTNRPKEEIDEFMRKNQITVTGQNQKRPVFHFNESGIPGHICQLLKKMDFSVPSVIQSIGWPHALSGSNVVGIAQTGSGKTLSFILPAILHIEAQKERKGDGPLALVICPTRELAVQCHGVAQQFRRVCNLHSTAVFGGASKMTQARQLQNPELDMVIATPGRLLDFLNSGDVNVAQCSYVVLDEADRMLDMGFEPQIRSVIQQIRPDCQLLMWSATWPEEIQDLATDFLKDYVHIQIGAHGQMVNPDITHEFEICSRDEKLNLLIDHLTNNSDHKDPRKPAKTLVFSATKRGCSHIEFRLRKAGIRVGSLHGDKSQSQREAAMMKFKKGIHSVIVASDVAARGLDVSDIEYVINYDLPQNIDSYIHRVGRTARAGKKGTAISYFTKEDVPMASKLIKLLQDVGHEVPEVLFRIASARTTTNSKGYKSRGPRY